jgi:hypothetical protein
MVVRRKRSSAKSSIPKKKQKAVHSWTAFDRAARRAIAEFQPRPVSDARQDLKDVGLTLPADLLRLVVSIDDGSRVDLSALGGAAHQELFDASGLLDANHPEDGGFGARVASGELPRGLVMFGFGPTQLVYDTLGSLGAAGSIWSCEDEDVTDATKLADSILELLDRATPPEREPAPPRSRKAPKKVGKLMPTPSAFPAPRKVKGLFQVLSEASSLSFLVRHGHSLWFGDEDGLFSFSLEKESWSPLRALPPGFVAPAYVSLPDGSVLILEWDADARAFLCARGDGRSAWKKAAALPSEDRLFGFGLGVLADGRVLLAGGANLDREDTDRAWVYSPKHDAWSPGPTLPEPTQVRNSIQTASGVHFLVTHEKEFTPGVLTLDAAGRWHQVSSTEMATSFVVAPLADGRQALVLREERDTACLVFDPNQRTLQPLPALPVGEGGPACEVQDGLLCAVRKTSSGEEFLALLKLSGERWVAGPALPPHHMVYAMARHGNRVFFVCLQLKPTRERRVLVGSAQAIVG